MSLLKKLLTFELWKPKPTPGHSIYFNAYVCKDCGEVLSTIGADRTIDTQPYEVCPDCGSQHIYKQVGRWVWDDSHYMARVGSLFTGLRFEKSGMV